MNPSYGDAFDEYKMLGSEKLNQRASLIKNNKKFAEKVSLILQEEAEEKEQSKSQEDIYEEEVYIQKFTSSGDNKIMPEFHRAEWNKKLSVLDKFKDERLRTLAKNFFMKKNQKFYLNPITIRFIEI